MHYYVNKKTRWHARRNALTPVGKGHAVPVSQHEDWYRVEADSDGWIHEVTFDNQLRLVGKGQRCDIRKLAPYACFEAAAASDKVQRLVREGVRIVAYRPLVHVKQPCTASDRTVTEALDAARRHYVGTSYADPQKVITHVEDRLTEVARCTCGYLNDHGDVCPNCGEPL